ncbi:MAG: alanine--glyoxylate aminotransferase family protein [Candidatus Atribacteria bacterium]|nr:alanine--glyoxylate aminotransferase family protein [Candidatus Atribacteria bacterium]
MKNRKLLMIPGPVEFEPAVLATMSEPTDSHVSPDFIESFGKALDMLKQVFFAPHGQPFVVAGSGTLAMEMAVINLVEPGDKVLVISAGYFGVRYRDILSRHEIAVTLINAPIGDTPPLEKVEEALWRDNYKLMTVTHVDTSTAVRSDVKALASLAHQYDM